MTHNLAVSEEEEANWQVSADRMLALWNAKKPV